jgi:MoaA/NifB/PqqE/SkfB family radical SAM enzyme
MDRRPFRAILNFTHKCAMSCEWCYVPFGSPSANGDVVNRVISRIADLGFTNLTIGGGDPFQYSFISKTLRHARSVNLFVHIDTHGKSLHQSVANLELIEETVDLLGLPLDGSKSQLHDQMRNTLNHFDLVCRRIEWLRPLLSLIKINTVVSAVNAQDMLELGELIKTIAPTRWSLYQYWPLGPAAGVESKYSISNVEFAKVTSILHKAMRDGKPSIEVNHRESRRGTYPIIDHDGNVFVHRKFPLDEFAFLGSIFDSNILQSICSACDSERPEAVTRYLGAK